MKRSNIFAGTILAAAILAAPLAASAATGFTGDFGPGSATVATSNGGSVDPTLAPDSITLTGGSGADASAPVLSDQTYAFAVAVESVLSFDWVWSTDDCCGAAFDGFGYRLNGGDLVFITEENAFDPSQAGHFSIGVHAGTVFALDQNSFDSVGPPGVTTVSDFNAVAGSVPEPATWGLMLAGFCLAGAALRRGRALSLA